MRRRQREPQRVEPPLWYRVYDPQSWDGPDEREQAVMDGCRGFGVWSAELHEIHAHRRWAEAKHAYRQEHPALAEQEFMDLVSGERRSREPSAFPEGKQRFL